MQQRAGLTPTQIEEGVALALDFTKLAQAAACGQDLVPVAVQDADTGEVLILAYANRQALEQTVSSGLATFWSTSRNQLWVKGASSGDQLAVIEVRVNCEQNALLYRVRPRGAGACHTRDREGRTRRGCFYRRIGAAGRLEPA